MRFPRVATAVVLMSAAITGRSAAGLHTETVEYKHGEVVLEGYLAYDDAVTGKRPGVLVIHEWTGHNPYARKRAEQLAQLGYVAFALDMYGKGVKAKDARDAAGKASVFKENRRLMRDRAQAGLEILQKNPRVDPKRIAAIGYCFGGTTALELARDGADLVGVVSFHGGLNTPTPADAKHIKGKVLVLHGAADPVVPPKEVADFEHEMKSAGVDFHLIQYPGAVHSFTNPGAGNDPSRGTAYNATADKESWAEMKKFFDKVFGS
jgi:dienelactone hydrolase